VRAGQLRRLLGACTGNENLTSANFSVYTVPDLSFVTPANQSYNTSNIVLNVSNSSSIPDSLILFNTSANNTYAGAVAVTLSEGTYNASVWANDTVGGSNSSTVYFTVDLTAPVVQVSQPANGSNYTNASGLALNFSASDALSGINATACSFNINGTLVAPGNCNNYSLSNYAQGNYTVTVTAYDAAGNSRTNSSTFWVDYYPPTVSLTNPVNNSNTTTLQPTFSYSVQDNASFTMNCTLYVDGTSAGVQTVSNGTTANYKSGVFAGAHIWSVSCSDDVGNTASTGNYTLHALSFGTDSSATPTPSVTPAPTIAGATVSVPTSSPAPSQAPSTPVQPSATASTPRSAGDVFNSDGGNTEQGVSAGGQEKMPDSAGADSTLYLAIGILLAFGVLYVGFKKYGKHQGL
ncbi:MAG: Ig-like domain-containing protein, partial [Candidatus Micrarchaeota archaeon]|nr:Ig-like domain-containing protein [Candidatus Micrarchaeota archaeon]